MTQREHRQPCPLAAAADLLNQGWSLLVVQQLLDGPRGFEALVADITVASPDQVGAAVQSLTAAGVIRVFDSAGSHALYTLTDLGRGLGPVVEALTAWGRQVAETDQSGSVGA